MYIWLAPVDVLLQFGVELHYKCLTPHSVQGLVSTLAFYAKAHGWLDETGGFSVQKKSRHGK